MQNLIKIEKQLMWNLKNDNFPKAIKRLTLGQHG